MASLPHETQILSSYLNFDEDVDYGSDNNIHGDKRILFDPPVPKV